MSAAQAPHPRVEVAIAVVERDGQFLIGLRPEGAALAGYWEFPGGKVAAGESPEGAVRRECLEETGLEVRITGSYPPADFEYPQGRVHLRFFACAPVAQRDPLPERFRWVGRAALAAYKFPPANADILRVLLASQSPR